MKIRVDQSVLAPAVSHIARYVQPKGADAALSAMILETVTVKEKDYLQLVAYDGQATGKTLVPVTIDTPGRILVSGALLMDIVRDLPRMEITLDSGENDATLQVSTKTTRYALSPVAVDKQPVLPLMPAIAGTIDAALFSSAVAQVARAAAKDSNNSLDGVRIEITKDTMTLVTCDRYRLARRTIPWEGADETPYVAYVSAKSLAASAAQFAKGGPLKVAVDAVQGTNFGLLNATSEVIVQETNDGFPPNYLKLFSTEFTGKAVVPVEQLVGVAKRIGKVLEGSAPALFSFTKNKVVVTAGPLDNPAGSEEVEIEYEGDDLVIAFNPLYLIDGLTAIDADDIRIMFNGGRRSAEIKATGKNGDFSYLLVPVLVGGVSD